MTLRYTVNPDDYASFGLWHYENAPTGRQAVRRILFWGNIFMVLLLGAGIFARPEELLTLGTIVLLGLLFLNLTLTHLTRWLLIWMYKKTYTAKENAKQFGENRIEVSADGMLIQTATSTALHKWNFIERVVNTPEYAYLLIGTNMGIVVPRAGVVEGNFDAFVAEAIRLHAEATVQNPVPLPIAAR